MADSKSTTPTATVIDFAKAVRALKRKQRAARRSPRQDRFDVRARARSAL